MEGSEVNRLSAASVRNTGCGRPSEAPFGDFDLQSSRKFSGLLQIPCAIEQGIHCMDQKSSANLIGKIDPSPDANFYNTGHALRISFDTDRRVTAQAN